MPLYILNDIISEMFKFGRTMNIKEQYYFNRGPGHSPGKFLKIYACSNFFDPPPSLGVWNFFDPPFWGFETFLTHLLIFQPPHQSIYERSLNLHTCLYAKRCIGGTHTHTHTHTPTPPHSLLRDSINISGINAQFLLAKIVPGIACYRKMWNLKVMHWVESREGVVGNMCFISAKMKLTYRLISHHHLQMEQLENR